MTIGNLSYEIRRLQVNPEKVMVSIIPIHKRDLFDIKIEIFYKTIRVNTKDKYNKKHLSDKFSGLWFEN